MYHQKSVIGIIEDDDDLRDALSDVIESLGYRTEHFVSAFEFLRAASTTQCACLVVDVDLNGMSGLEAAGRLIELGHRYPIIFITVAGNGLDEEMRKLGGVALLHKPFFCKELSDALEHTLRLRA